jgi:hypothetical protein
MDVKKLDKVKKVRVGFPTCSFPVFPAQQAAIHGDLINESVNGKLVYH